MHGDFINQGNVFSTLGMYKEAIRAYRQAIDDQPQDARVYHCLGSSYAQLGLYKQAREYMKTAVRMQPGYVEAHYSLAMIYLALNDRGSALKQYRILKELDVDWADKLMVRMNR